MTPPADQAERDRARFGVGSNTVVEAGAGTGKTTLLAERLLAVVLAGGPGRRGIPVERIAALTFTEKAAGELKDRVAEHLEDILAALSGGRAAEALDGKRRDRAEAWLREARARFGRGPDEVKAAAEAALGSLDRAMIGTLHQFAARILRLHPIAAGVDPAFVVDEGERIGALFEQEWALWLDAELAEAAPRRAAWLEVLAAARLDDLRVLALALAEPKIDLDRLHAGPEGPRRAAALASAALRAVEGRPKTTAKGVFERAKAAAAALARFQQPAPIAVPARIEACELPDGKWPTTWKDEPGREDLDAAARAARATPESDLLLARAAALLRPFVEGFRRSCARRGWISFDGLLVAARDLVRDDLAARRALQEEFRALLVDEFQDTDPLQGETVLFLGERSDGAAKDWRDLRFEPGRLFVVGDPKQSIYQFRGADIRAYEGFTRLLAEGGADRCTLSCNFRSAAAVLTPVNAAFGRLMTVEAGLQPPYQPLSAAAADAPGAGVSVRLCVSADGTPLDTDASVEGEAADIARWVAAECGAGRPYRFKDVAVLVRSTAPLRAMVEAFKAAGIPYAVEAERFFYETQEVTDFLNLLRVLDDPSDRISLAGLLRSPLVAIEDRELAALAPRLDYRSEPPVRGLSPASRRRVSEFYAVLQELRALVGRRPLQEVVAGVLARTALVELGAAAYHSDQTVANLHKFARMAAARGEAEGHTLKEYIASIEREQADERAREGESPLADDRFDAVRLLTMHKAKGLEWRVVFLPNLTSAPSPGGRDPDAVVWDPADARAGLCLPRDRHEDLGYALLEESRRRREERERVRLLYVAMTRAKERLFLLGNAAPAGGFRTASFAGMLREAGLWPADHDAEGPVAAARIRADAAGPMAAAAPPARAVTDWKALGAVWMRRESERDEIALRTVFVSPAAEAEKEKRSYPFEDDETAPAPALVGQVCHLVLERWDYRVGGPLDTALADARRALEPRHPGADWAAVAAESAAVLTAFLGSEAAKELKRVEVLGRELPILYADGGQVVHGALDLLYELDGKLVVADYKTDHVKGALVEAAARHAPQAARYAECVERALGRRPEVRLIFLRRGESVAL